MNKAILGLAVVLAACGSSGDEAADGTSATEPSATSSTSTSVTTAPESTTTTGATGTGVLVIAAIDFDDGTYTLRNDGDGPIDLSGYFACNRPNYVELPAETLSPGGTIDIDAGGLSLSANDGELGVYNSQSFSSISAIQAYVQWGSDGHGRTGTAVEAGVWTAGEFVDNAGSPIVSSGSNPVSASDWVAAAAP